MMRGLSRIIKKILYFRHTATYRYNYNYNKHDEKYMPPEVAAALQAAGSYVGPAAEKRAEGGKEEAVSFVVCVSLSLTGFQAICCQIWIEPHHSTY